MENNRISKHTISFGLSLVVCSLMNAVLVIAKEKSSAVQSTMQKLTGHHWVTHAMFILMLFVILGFLFASATISVNRLIRNIVVGVFVSGFVIVGFYLISG